MNTLIQILVGVVVFFLIFTYLLPMLTGIVHAVALIVVVMIAIIWLLGLAGASFPWPWK